MTKRTNAIICQLSAAFDIRLVAFSRRNHQSTESDRAAAAKALSRFAAVSPAATLPSEWSYTRRAWNHLRSAITGNPYTFYDYHSRVFRRSLEEVLEENNVDLVHMDSLDLHRWLELLPDVPISCTHHSVESQLLQRRANHVKSPVLSRYLSLQGRLVERVEKRICPRLALNIVMSEVDAAKLRSIAPGSRTAVVPNGVDTVSFSPGSVENQVPGRVVFLGPLYMLPNRDSVDLFVTEMWPLIVKEEKGATFQVIGKVSAEQKRKYEEVEGVSCVGFVDDIRHYLESAQCFVVPLRIGGGTRLKILDAWSMGKAVVSTSIGCEGLHTVDGENILIRDEPGEFSDAVLQVLRTEELRTRLERYARITACERYSWDIIGAELRKEYGRILSDG